MAQAVFDSPIREIKGGQVSVDKTNVAYTALEPGYHEVILDCAAEGIKFLLNPALECVLVANGTTYTDYTSYAKDKSSSTHVPLDAMNGAKSQYLYLGAPDTFKGVYVDMGTNIGNTAVNVAWQYPSDAINFTALTVDSDGTNNGGGPLGKDGAFIFNSVPANWHKRSIGGYGGSDLYWVRMVTDAALNATVDVNELFSINKGTDYGYLKKDEDHRFSLNTQKVGAIQLLSAANTGTVNVTWIKH